MKSSTLACLILTLASFAPFPALGESAWSGVDETVIERVADEAGHPPRDPLINTDQGDLLLFLFLVAGTVGGFVAGYTYRGLFSLPKGAHTSDAPAR